LPYFLQCMRLGYSKGVGGVSACRGGEAHIRSRRIY